MRSKIVKSVFLIGAIVFLTIGSSGAYLSDIVTVSGNSFTAGTWEESSVPSSLLKPIKEALDMTLGVL